MRQYWRYASRGIIILLLCLGLVIIWPLNINKQSNEGLANAPESLENLVASNPSLKFQIKEAVTENKSDVDCKKVKCVALTFDDGPSSGSTSKILDSLEREKVVATFFLIGKKISLYSNEIHRMYKDGNEIGNHSWDHKDFDKLKPSQIIQELRLTDDSLTALGVPETTVVRPPYGDLKLGVIKLIKKPIIMWNVDPKDWSQKNPKAVAKSVINQARNGAIIVLHDKPATAKATEEIIRVLKAKYNLVTVSQLMKLNDSSRGLYFGYK